jgi:hypothetical protein
MSTTIRFMSFPQTEPPPKFIRSIVEHFIRHEAYISTTALAKGLTSDRVLAVLAPDLMSLGFQVETNKSSVGKVDRPVLFGENGIPTRRYQIDAYHDGWFCGLEVEAGRAWLGNAIYRDLFQAAVMVGVQHLCLAVSNSYKFRSGGKKIVSQDYTNAISVAATLYGHTRLKLPYGLTIIGY